MANPKRDVHHLARVRAATILPKPWGRELCYAREPHYEAKILEVKKGNGVSPEDQGFLSRNLHVLSGAVWFQLNGIEFDLIPGACINIRPGDHYVLHAVEDCVVLEVSTPQQTAERPLQEGQGSA